MNKIISIISILLLTSGVKSYGQLAYQDNQNTMSVNGAEYFINHKNIPDNNNLIVLRPVKENVFNDKLKDYLKNCKDKNVLKESKDNNIWCLITSNINEDSIGIDYNMDFIKGNSKDLIKVLNFVKSNFEIKYKVEMKSGTAYNHTYEISAEGFSYSSKRDWTSGITIKDGIAVIYNGPTQWIMNPGEIPLRQTYKVSRINRTNPLELFVKKTEPLKTKKNNK